MATANQQGQTDATVRFTVGVCSLGAFLIAWRAQGLCAILIDDQPASLIDALKRRFPAAAPGDNDPQSADMLAAVAAFIDDPSRDIDLPLAPFGTPFQHRVWRALREIPAGTTASYREIAERIGAPGAARAVARACADNPLAVVIPCHRIIRSNGALSGYRWGIDRKRKLLKREAA